MIEVNFDKFGLLQNNCYLITDTTTNMKALVDCTNSSERMEKLIGNSLDYILLTHGHFDHISGVAKIAKKYNSKIAMNINDVDMITSSDICLQSVDYFKPDILVNDGDQIKLGASIIKIIETPGHTKGGICFICDDSIFTGDTLFRCSCGRTDFPGGSFDEIKNSLIKISNLKGQYKVYPGHEELTDLDFERKFNPYMKNDNK